MIENPGPGRLLAFTGLDGSGKSTLVKGALDWLNRRGIEHHHAVLPTRAARQNPHFREYVKDHTTAETPSVDLLSICVTCDADVLRFVRTEATQLLEAGMWVVCDRYVFCSYAEMFAARCSEEDFAALRALHRLLLRPDLSVLARVDVQEAISRVRSRPDERDAIADPGYWARIAEGFDLAAQELPLLAIDTGSTPESALALLEVELERLAAA